ncbi:hypothetical protein AYO21_11686 [Fonsecaea monophora]|uniref:Uncharacterized protein n=1 Tax=Fonsecaea monophora TaxID=254056 RepID=A0A177EQ82_9EURO|nr:hypothetical protein AYO21_11686 [Fonsecaea monophora]OAG34154.1 hypothetical protein AYO21_11686 [Fonsecaea monophora]
MFPNSSNSEFSNDKSVSNSLGGVAVLALLDVTALFLLMSFKGGKAPPGEVGDPRLPFTSPKENVLVGLRRKPGLVETGGGGAGISLNGLDPAPPWTFLSDLVSTEEGFVDEVLRRADDAALSLGAVEWDRSVPPLPLDTIVSPLPFIWSTVVVFFAYRLLASGRPTPNKSTSSWSRRSFGGGNGAPPRDAIFKCLPPSNDFPLLCGLSKTRKEASPGGLRTSSKAWPEDFRR